MKIVVVVPSYNCEKSIKKVIGDLNNHFVDKIIVIDDGSWDQTADFARQAGAEVISHRTNKGLGCALRTGFREALKRGYDLILTFDGDGQHLASDIKKVKGCFDKHPEADIVIGTRLKDKKHWYKFPRHRLFGNLILTALTNFACRRRKFTTDSQSGYRAIKRSALGKLELSSERMAISSEIIIEARYKKLKMIEIPIIPTYGEEISNQRLIADTAAIIRLVLTRSFRKKKRIKKRKSPSPCRRRAQSALGR